jgi:cyclophilin family peptidyl-prolyl cis-trans isomerase/HEAT repeat protein
VLTKSTVYRIVTKNRNSASPLIRFALSLSLHALLVCSLLLLLSTGAVPQRRTRALQNSNAGDPVSKILLLQIVRAEDERRWDDDLLRLFSARNANVRTRAALAAGRIGNPDAVAELVRLLQRDDETEVRAMAAFALGEIESPLAADALAAVVRDKKNELVRARAVEALGKIAAALPKEQEARARELGAVILEALTFEARRRSAPDSLTILLGLTATLRAKPANAGPIVSEFLGYSDPRIRADAANTLARLKLNDGSEQLRKLLMNDPDPVVRANAARVLGATEDKAAFEALLDRALNDKDQRVRVSAIRSLTSLKDQRAVEGFSTWRRMTLAPSRDNETLEVATMLGRILQGSENKEALAWLTRVRERFNKAAPEAEIAYARISPVTYLAQLGNGKAARQNAQRTLLLNWRSGSSLAQGLGEIAALPGTTQDKKQLDAEAEDILRAMLDYRNSGLVINTLVAVNSEYAIPDVLRAFAAFKPKDLGDVLRRHLKESDVVVRATAADLLGELPPDESNTRALIAALPVALSDKGLNDAALSILDSLGKVKTAQANEAIRTALGSQDYLIRRKAVAVLKANGDGDFALHIGIVQTRNTTADYERALARIGKRVNAVVTTSKGMFTIALLPDEAPLTVDNFIQIAKRGYFGGITIHRVVPNFVIQDGDPRGDGNGGPGYQIRCEINEVPYNRGALGMALSGKDTGGSQWFVTHSPQPHLDGGYTVFGNVVSGMEVIDSIVRGDIIRSIAIAESVPRTLNRRQ